jgi:single-stranded DNA-binding protein
MKSLNKVQIIGNLTRDPELRTTPNGQESRHIRRRRLSRRLPGVERRSRRRRQRTRSASTTFRSKKATSKSPKGV